MDDYLLRRMRRGASVPLEFCLALSLLSAAGCSPTTPAARSPDAATDHTTTARLPDPDPVAFLEKCLERYDRQEIRGYRAILYKQERIDSHLNPPEEIEICYRTHPRSVFMHWLQGARRAESILYVEGEYGAKILVHPSGPIGRIMKEMTIDPDSPAARQAGRYSIKDLGLREALERTVRQWQGAREQSELQVEYLGVKRVPEADDRRCYTLRRTFTKPEKDGVTEATVFIDYETWFQVGTALRGESRTLIGEYMYRDVGLNPPFDPNQFEPSALAGRAVK
jgi:hypothetical protein